MNQNDQWRQLGVNWMRWDGQTLRSVRKVSDGYEVRIQHLDQPTRVLAKVDSDCRGRVLADEWEVTA